MTTNAAMSGLMSWLKGLASWVLDLFHLAGSGGFSPLGWLSGNWIRLLVFFLIVGIAADLLVWLLRWRPYWVWFNKRRIVIGDDDFFVGEELVDSGLYDPKLFYDPEREISASRPTAQPRRAAGRSFAAAPAPGSAPRPRSAPPRRPGARPGTSAPGRSGSAAQLRGESEDPFRVDPASAVNPETGEDAVFNVSDLPVSKDELAFQHKRR